MSGRQPFVVEAELELADGCDLAAVGAAVTTELCGHWEHEPPCRWPHNSAIEPGRDAAAFRTLFVAAAGDESEVLARIEASLRRGDRWRVIAVRERPVGEDERELARRLLAA